MNNVVPLWPVGETRTVWKIDFDALPPSHYPRRVWDLMRDYFNTFPEHDAAMVTKTQGVANGSVFSEYVLHGGFKRGGCTHEGMGRFRRMDGGPTLCSGCWERVRE